MFQNSKSLYFLILLLVLFSCNENVKQESSKVIQNDSIKADPIIPEGFNSKAFFDSVVNVAKKNDFDTLAQGGLLKSDHFETDYYISMILRKKDAEAKDLDGIYTLYNCILKSNSIKKADSRDITVDVYVCKDSLTADFWKGKLKSLYDNSGGEPLKELYYLTVSGNVLVHTTTRAFMWQEELDKIQKACKVLLEN
ncbi:MAG: hypothetical protein CVU05_01550 [Bacteroidetes bacterium HGW-Bacteroidetes-21]|nr:MAG: hypothetical protein CVU05_01550 [Bacteroidetes bacterium HGW-Bacteroidetes-21]